MLYLMMQNDRKGELEMMYIDKAIMCLRIIVRQSL